MNVLKIIASKIGLSKSNIQRRQSDEESDRFHSTPTPDILKLNIDCFENVFDYLPYEDLVSIGKTCKRLQQVAGHCYRQTYPNMESRVCKRLIQSRWLDVTHFAEFIGILQIFSHAGLPTFFKIQSRLRRLKEMEVWDVKLTKSEIDRMKDTLGRLEVLSLRACKLRKKVKLNDFLDHCAKLTRLYIHWSDVDNDFLNQTYPRLEWLKFFPSKNQLHMDALVKFLQLNSNIRTFETSGEFLWANRDSLKNTSDIKLNDLVIQTSWSVDFISFCQLLNELHERGFYQRLCVYELYPNEIDQLATLNGLVGLGLYELKKRLPALPYLEVMHVGNWIADPDSVANTFVNLKRASFFRARFDDIMPFIRRLMRLRQIYISQVENGIYFNEDTKIIDLVGLNRERQQLAGAAKITLYVSDIVYLATKWAVKETNFDMIRLRRCDDGWLSLTNSPCLFV